MQDKKRCIALCALFCLFIAGGLVWNLLTPDRVFSPMENRNLAQKPAFSLQALFSGEYTADMETYLTDQFAGRDWWVGLKYYSERALLKTENNGIYFAGGDRLIERFDEPVEGRPENNLAAVSALAEATGLPVDFSLIPTAAYIYADSLPKNAPGYDQQGLLELAAQTLPQQYFDLSQVLMENRDLPAFYRTDHHWTSDGAFAAYEVIARRLGFEPLPKPEGKTVVTGFFGTLYSQAGARGYESEDIVYYDASGLSLWVDGEEKPFYDLSYVDQKDKYSLFLGGNYPVCIIRNEQNPDGEKLLLIKDSFSNSLVPFLARHFSEIHMIDPRYYMLPMSEYTSQNAIDRVLVLYQTKNFVQDSAIVLVAK